MSKLINTSYEHLPLVSGETARSIDVNYNVTTDTLTYKMTVYLNEKGNAQPIKIQVQQQRTKKNFDKYLGRSVRDPEITIVILLCEEMDKKSSIKIVP